MREGLIAVLSVKLPNPRFESQTKVKLVNTEIDGIVNSTVYDGLMTHFDKNPRSPAAFSKRSLLRRERAKLLVRREKLFARVRSLAAVCRENWLTVPSAIRN